MLGWDYLNAMIWLNSYLPAFNLWESYRLKVEMLTYKKYLCLLLMRAVDTTNMDHFTTMHNPDILLDCLGESQHYTRFSNSAPQPCSFIHRRLDCLVQVVTHFLLPWKKQNRSLTGMWSQTRKFWRWITGGCGQQGKMGVFPEHRNRSEAALKAVCCSISLFSSTTIPSTRVWMEAS